MLFVVWWYLLCLFIDCCVLFVVCMFAQLIIMWVFVCCSLFVVVVFVFVVFVALSVVRCFLFHVYGVLFLASFRLAFGVWCLLGLVRCL